MRLYTLSSYMEFKSHGKPMSWYRKGKKGYPRREIGQVGQWHRSLFPVTWHHIHHVKSLEWKLK
jgi:hypothetical protein